MKYAIDKIEGNLVVLEELNTQEKKEINIKELPKKINEGTILTYVNDTYIIDEKLEKDRRVNIQSKFDMLRKK